MSESKQFFSAVTVLNERPWNAESISGAIDSLGCVIKTTESPALRARAVQAVRTAHAEALATSKDIRAELARRRVA
jgi:hypothetical protein